PDLYVINHNGVGLTTASIEGSYLKGYGVLFSITLPAPLEDELTLNLPAQALKVATDWDRTRQQLRGERTWAPAQAKKTTVADILMKVLAENGKNFTHLPPNESLTIAVTFRGQPAIPSGMPGPGGTSSGPTGMAPGMGSSLG